jgi:ketosteroid isomerase-like protein
MTHAESRAAHTTAVTPSAADTVRALRREFNRALAARDTAAFGTLFADNATFASPLVFFKGRQAIVSHYMSLMTGRQITLVFDPKELHGQPPFLSEYGVFHQEWDGGKKMDGSYFAAWTLTPNGRWILNVQAWTPLDCNRGACELNP